MLLGKILSLLETKENFAFQCLFCYGYALRDAALSLDVRKIHFFFLLFKALNTSHCSLESYFQCGPDGKARINAKPNLREMVEVTLAAIRSNLQQDVFHFQRLWIWDLNSQSTTQGNLVYVYTGLGLKCTLAAVPVHSSLQLLHLRLFLGICSRMTLYLILLSDVHLKVKGTELSHPALGADLGRAGAKIQKVAAGSQGVWRSEG